MELKLKGGARAQWVSQARGLRTFRVGTTGMKIEVSALWFDRDSRVATIHCNSGTWRLPDVLLPWAQSIEERTESLGYGSPWPCWAVFEEDPDGVIEVEIFPDGYPPAER